MRSPVERALSKVIANGIEALRDSGTINISARTDDESVLIVVEDSGTGIPAEVRDNLFEPFVTCGKAEGLGLGLAIA